MFNVKPKLRIVVTDRYGDTTDVSDWLYYFEENHIDSLNNQYNRIQVFLDDKEIWSNGASSHEGRT
jgi:hypothetical protein